MTPTELHALMEPCREAMEKDGIWPRRGDRNFVWSRDRTRCWYTNLNTCPIESHPDDAHNAFLAALLGWALNQAESNCLIGIDTIPGHINVPWSKHPTPLHALVSAYRKAKEIK